MSNPVAGWYADPEPGSTKMRYWDGTQWTDQCSETPVATAADAATAAATAAATPVVAASVDPVTGQPQTAVAPVQPGYSQPGYGQPGYMQPGYGQSGAVAPQKNGMAVASLVCGLVGLFVFGFVLGVLAIILGVLARKRPDRKGMATAGIILGAIALVGWVIVMVMLFGNA
ncbi:MAG: DUF4190 domain-containing protein [Eggerthellaceae bacterium]|jgi:hypothetical protein|nr:DUF4190 domain-containing protein [Eggerthellaceae bacterium]MDR2721296.1 DUF4190 domain-containing protein [Coriobacteriaceae bacterium]